MDSSANLRPRKRKQCSSSDPVNGRFTRNKSRMHVHRTRSGRTWPDTPARKPFNKPHLLLGKPLMKPSNVHHLLPENESSLDLSIKDLRTRARRVFSPTSVVEAQSGKFELGIGFAKEGYNWVPNVVDNHENLDLGIRDSELGLKNSDMESDLGFACSDKEERGDRADMGSDAASILDKGSRVQPDKEGDVKLNEKTPVMEKNKEGNNVENGKDCSGSKRNGAISGSKSVLNSSSKRKVFKAPSSFSYRRLLPFLTEMAKDDSSTLRIDVVDVDYPCKAQNLNSVGSNLSSALAECHAGNHNHIDDQSDHTKGLDEGDCRYARVQLPVKGQDLDDRTKKMVETEETVSLDVEQRNHEKGMNGVDELIEEFVQTTPPDDTIFTKLDNDNAGASREFSDAQNGNLILAKPSNENNASNALCFSTRPHPPRKSNTISNGKLVLNPCSRSKIFKSSSFSYRRLLPFLTDVAKSTANVDEPPKFQRKDDDCHSVAKESAYENVPADRTRRDAFLENLDAEDHEPFPRPVNPPISGSSHEMVPDIPSPFFNSGDSPRNKKSNTAFSEAIAKPDDMPLLERTSQYELVTSDSSRKLEIKISANVIKSCHNENSFSAETSCCAIHQESFTTGSKSDLSQVSEHEPTDVAKECIMLGLDYHKDKLELVKSAGLYQTSPEMEEFDHQGNQSDSPMRGILKRNPKGCRGLCNCLNCSSFRLHAERSFEFSKNQMLDAEEVAHGLINELAELRSLLEKSVFGDSDLVAIQINQAKEACKRALKTEQLAKSRLSQMNDDLKIHCRIRPLQRPRVTFYDISARTNLQKQDEKAKI